MNQVAHLYKITNKKTGEYYYGKHNGREQDGYWGSGRRIQNQLKKYGADNFNYEVLVISTVEYIYELEKKLVTPILIESDNKCLNLTCGGLGVGYMTEASRQKLRRARAKQVMPADMYVRTSKIMSSLVWMNDGVKSYRVRPDKVEASKQQGMVEGRITNYINTEYKNKLKMTTSNQWKKVKQTGHKGLLIKVQS